jgi:hypothetical protein
VACFISVLLASTAIAVPIRKPVGWVLDPYFTEMVGGHDQPDVSHDFYPKGESSVSWTERILLRSQEVGVGTSPSAVLDGLADTFRKECPEMSENRFPMPGDEAAERALSMWHCHENPQTHRGQVLVKEVLVIGNHAYVMTAEGNYSPFAKGKTALTHEQLSRWAATQKSLVACGDLTNPGCLPDPEAVMTAMPAVLSNEQAVAVHLAESRGLEMYRQDQLAWHATDFLVSHGGIQKSDEGGFIAVPGSGKDGVVYFYRRSGGRVTGATRVVVDAAGNPMSREEIAALPEDIGARIRALQAARTAGPELCSQTINSAVMPTEDGKGWWVYILTGTKEPNLMYLGGHTRIRIGSGEGVLTKEPSAKSCLAMKTDARDQEGRPITALLATHLVSDMPWETHVFQSLTFHKTIIVVTHDAVWRVEDGRITQLNL